MKFRRVRFILGDQLNHQHSWFEQVDPQTLYVIAELHQEQKYVLHHVQKQCAFLAAMRQFANALTEAGHEVHYLDLDQTARYRDLTELLADVCQQAGAELLQYQRPDEYRLLTQLADFSPPKVVVDCVDSEHFLLNFDEIDQQFPCGKHVLMEHFYRRMRTRFDLLMDEQGKPLGGKWNFDAENRNKLKISDLESLPQPLQFANDVSEILERLQRHQIANFGRAEVALLWPVSRAQALTQLAHFCQVCLPNFGRFQDAMTCQHPSQWSLYHSRLSFALNCKLLSPLEVVEAAIDTFHHVKGAISLAQVEGFVRQIVGWREYVRGIYWANMPGYAKRNLLNAGRPLPEYFWNAQTHMNCVHHAVSQSLNYAYAHHIQRLMVTGNFAMLAELNPDQVDAWYLGIYVDALEWVEMPNTRGMALFADGGIIATKPYAASGSYINRMSDYCSSCRYRVKERSGDLACPLNSLYWRFMVKHRDQLANNPRIGMVYRNWDKLTAEAQDAILATAEKNLQRLESL
ncbi:cryptochrome/photolyase family protein [Vibrio sp. V39_P1S14PM300]|uniref:cryptochrome/photolyase family protein n=1 Tax=Vibrio sp. V39_P1S14PM300 TaxID=1938690 RepID=UPI00137331F3|nr:cryptochrome/photolyase family protein [Vibrio sp. V39_P1S14PM300]NAX19944.1 cryptochrome/photolyase family protein [Vibrio sp. V39_P1S14PM300]